MLDVKIRGVAVNVILVIVISSAFGASIESNSAISSQVINPDEILTTKVPDSDGRFHFYVFPVGQGDAHLIQCPDGDLTVVDLGSADSVSSGYWTSTHIDYFLQGQYHLIRNVVITHNHDDHYRFLPSVLNSNSGLTGLQNIYVSCDVTDMHINVQNWLRNISGENKVRTFNEGKECGPNGVPCGFLDLCPGDSRVQAKVMAANMGQCASFNKNLDSVVFKIIYNQVSLMFNGDFEDATPNANENGPQNKMVDYYGDELQVTVYKLSRHGGQSLANKPRTCHAHAPRAVFVSASPGLGPRCDVIDYFINNVGTLCKPAENNPASPDYCSEHPNGDIGIRDKLLETYTCSGGLGGSRVVTDNQFAIYTTVPESHMLNIINFITDGVKWGFVNQYYPK